MAVFSRMAVAVPFVFAFFSSVSASSSCSGNVTTVIEYVTEYDYVIVGGGLTGLVVANRLSEDRNSKS